MSMSRWLSISTSLCIVSALAPSNAEEPSHARNDQVWIQMDVDFFEVTYQDLSSSWPVDCPTLESLDALARQDKAQILGSYSLPLESGMRGAITPMRVGIDPPSTQEGVCSIPPSSTVFSHVTYPTEFEFMMYPVTNENGAVEMAGPIAPPTQFAHQETGIQFTMLPSRQRGTSSINRNCAAARGVSSDNPCVRRGRGRRTAGRAAGPRRACLRLAVPVSTFVGMRHTSCIPHRASRIPHPASASFTAKFTE
jgi:hypothetical protein